MKGESRRLHLRWRSWSLTALPGAGAAIIGCAILASCSSGAQKTEGSRPDPARPAGSPPAAAPEGGQARPPAPPAEAEDASGGQAGPAAESEGTDAGDRSELTALEKETEEPRLTDLPEKFSLKLGGGFVFDSQTTLAFGGEQAQAQIDWHDTLGGDTRALSSRLDARYRFSPYHSLSLSHYDVLRSGSRGLDRDVEIGDKTFTVDTKLDTELFLNITRLYYSYSFYRSRQVELQLNGGFYFGYLGVSGSAFLGSQSVTHKIEASETILVPVPSLGFGMSYNIFPRIMTFLSTDYFYLEVSSFKGSLIDFIFGLEYRPFDHIGIGAALNRMVISVDGSFTTSGYKAKATLDNDWNIAFFYLAFYL